MHNDVRRDGTPTKQASGYDQGLIGLGVAAVRRSGKKLTCREKKNLQYEYSSLVTCTSLIQTASFHACTSQQVRLHGQIYRACPNTDQNFGSCCALFYDVTAVSLLCFRRQLISPRRLYVMYYGSRAMK